MCEVLSFHSSFKSGTLSRKFQLHQQPRMQLSPVLYWFVLNRVTYNMVWKITTWEAKVIVELTSCITLVSRVSNI